MAGWDDGNAGEGMVTLSLHFPCVGDSIVAMQEYVRGYF